MASHIVYNMRKCFNLRWVLGQPTNKLHVKRTWVPNWLFGHLPYVCLERMFTTRLLGILGWVQWLSTQNKCKQNLSFERNVNYMEIGSWRLMWTRDPKILDMKIYEVNSNSQNSHLEWSFISSQNLSSKVIMSLAWWALLPYKSYPLLSPPFEVTFWCVHCLVCNELHVRCC